MLISNHADVIETLMLVGRVIGIHTRPTNMCARGLVRVLVGLPSALNLTTVVARILQMLALQGVHELCPCASRWL